MDIRAARYEEVGPRFGERPAHDLPGLFGEGDEDDEESGAFGPLAVIGGWMGPAGPGMALRTTLRCRFDPRVHAVEVRLRAGGRYVRSRVAGMRDRHGDLVVHHVAAPVVTAFVPWAALSPRAQELVVEAWLVEDGEPVEEGVWALPLPDWEERRLENALTAVALALVSLAPARGAGLASSGAFVDTLTGLFLLDAVGVAWAREIVADAEPESERMIATRLGALVHPTMLPRVLAALAPFAVGPRAAKFLVGVTEQLGARRAPPPRLPRPAKADPLAVLGLSPGATQAEIKAAFHRAAATHHPDRVPEADRAAATEAMKRINAAYDALRRR